MDASGPFPAGATEVLHPVWHPVDRKEIQPESVSAAMTVLKDFQSPSSVALHPPELRGSGSKVGRCCASLIPHNQP